MGTILSRGDREALSKMNASEVIKAHLRDAHVMQVATVSKETGRPWVCSVYVAMDPASTQLYWLSLPGRRHSVEIADNAYAAVALVIESQLPVVGVQAEGLVAVVQDSTLIEQVMEEYVRRHHTGTSYADRFKNGSAKHVLYCFTPSRFSLFDERQFPDYSPLEWVVEA